VPASEIQERDVFALWVVNDIPLLVRPRGERS
jgi:hypothetical protein